jgi:hypothetical protein
VVAPQFFAALRIPLLRGRPLDERDDQASAPAVVINRKAAEDLFPGQDPLGAGEPGSADGAEADDRGRRRRRPHHGLDIPWLQVYVPQAQWAWARRS